MLDLYQTCCAVGDLRWLQRTLIGKARGDPSILDDEGFLRAVLAEARRLREQIRIPVESARFKAAISRFVRTQWADVDAATRAQSVSAAVDLIRGLPSAFLPGVEVVLERDGARVLSATHRALGKKFKRLSVNANFASENARAVEALKRTQSIFFKPEYEARAEHFRERAQKIIATGLERGLGSRDIGQELGEGLRSAALGDAYWETVAANHVARGRSFSSAATYAENGITEYEFVAIKDSRTTEICWALDGSRFQVAAAMDSFDALEDAKSLDDVKRLAPMVRRQGDALTVRGRRIGSAGSTPRVDLSPDQLQAAGIHMPPLHHRCRSTVVPVFD